MGKEYRYPMVLKSGVAGNEKQKKRKRNKNAAHYDLLFQSSTNQTDSNRRNILNKSVALITSEAIPNMQTLDKFNTCTTEAERISCPFTQLACQTIKQVH